MNSRPFFPPSFPPTPLRPSAYSAVKKKGNNMAETRTQILDRFRTKIAKGLPIIGGGAGTGISAKMEEAGGIDLIVIYNSGRFRMSGHGSMAGLMPYGDANAIVMEM